MDKLKYLDAADVQAVWSSETLTQIEKLLNKKYLAYLNDENFTVESGFDSQQVQIKISLNNIDESKKYPIEMVCLLTEAASMNREELAFLLLDYVDIYWTEYLTVDRDTFVSMDWAKHSCEGVAFFMRGFERRADLEREAERIFSEHGHGEHAIQSITAEL